MLRHLGLIAVCACIVAGVGCDGGKLTAPDPPSLTPDSDVVPDTMVRVEFGGRVVNADAGGPVGNVRVSVSSVGFRSREPAGWSDPKDTATSAGDGTFTLPLNLPMGWINVDLRLTAPPGYDDTNRQFQPTTVADRPAIRMYQTIVIRPDESIDVRVDSDIVSCGFAGEAGPCRRVLVGGSSDDPVELEVVPDDNSKPMALSPDDWGSMPVRRLLVPPSGSPYILGAGTARLTARR